MNPLGTFWLRVTQRKRGFGWVVVAGLAVLVVGGVSTWFYTYKISTQMSMETWANYAGKLQARVWFQEGRYRLLELTSDEKSQFTGRTNGPFEIWTWTHYTNTPSLTVQTADQEFVDAFNSRMKQLWDGRQRAAELDGPANGGQPPSDATIRRMIIGTWGGDRNDRHARVTYATNGTYSYTNWVTGKQVPNFSPYGDGTWRIQDRVIISTVTKTGNSRLDPIGSVSRTRFLLINKTNMIGVTQCGNTNRVERIK